MPPIQNSSPSHNNNAAQADEHQNNPNPHERKRGTPPRKHRNSSTNQIVQMFKTDFILANVAFFVKVISGKKCCCYRSAGACPPRSLRRNEKHPQPGGHGRFLFRLMHGEGNPLACACGRRGPKPYGSQRGFLRFTVARGPVPRDPSAETKNTRSPEAMDVFCSDRCMARDRPSPYVSGARFG